MSIYGKVLLDSVSPAGVRLTTFEVKFPKIFLAEFNTHRALSRNSASSRAIPVEKTIQSVMDDPFLPVYWGKNQRGMQAAEELDDQTLVKWPRCPSPCVHLGTVREEAKIRWLAARDRAVEAVRGLQEIDLHKQIANRILEPWMYTKIIVSATDWANFFHLRTHKDAQPEFQVAAKSMKKAYDESRPVRLSAWDWHMPLIFEEDWQLATELAASKTPDELRAESTVEYAVTPRDWTQHFLRKVSVGRCARVSYLSHFGTRDLVEDIQLHDRLLSGRLTGSPMHLSPFEHVARALDEPKRIGNFRGFQQYRKMLTGEEGPAEACYE